MPQAPVGPGANAVALVPGSTGAFLVSDALQIGGAPTRFSLGLLHGNSRSITRLFPVVFYWTLYTSYMVKCPSMPPSSLVLPVIRATAILMPATSLPSLVSQ